MSKPFISICIPSYNRPEKVYKLLRTIDVDSREGVEVVVSDDCSPKQKEIRGVVEEFAKTSRYSVVFHANEKNLGYDGNLKETVKAAHGEWIVFMGDDDEFIPGVFNKVIKFIKEHADLVYILRAYEVIHNDGQTEKFRYYSGSKFFNPSEETYEEIFRKSVFISGFTIKREAILPYLVDTFDGSALIQIYWVAELVLKNKSAYFDEPFTRIVKDKAYKEKELMYDEKIDKWVKRRADLQRSLDFLGGYLKITRFMDEKYGFNSTKKVLIDLSKYSYPSLSIHRDEGIGVFLKYLRGLNKLGINATVYYYIYAILLIVFGRKFCDWGIIVIKRLVGKTPRL